MLIFLIIGIILGGLAVIFALQNITVITVTFLSWRLEGSLAVILLLAVAVGILIALLLTLPKSISNYFKYNSLKKENGKLEEELRKQKELTTFAKTTPPTHEVIAKIEEGAIADSASM